MLPDATRGASDALRGARFILVHPRLWSYIVAPALVALVALVLIVTWLIGAVGAPLAGLVEFVPGAWAESVVQVLVGIVMAVLSLSVFLSVAALIAAPFNEMMSESIEELVTGRRGERFRLLGFGRDLVVGVAHAARRVAIYLVIIATLFAVSWIVPGIGALVATAVGAIVTARFASYDAYDAVWSRRRWRYAEKTAYLRQRRWRSLGLGAAVAALLLVPGLNLIALSIGAAGATLAFLDDEKASAAASSSASRA